MKKVFALLIAAAISFPPIVNAAEERLKTEDLAGSFLLIVDKPDACLEGEIDFRENNECTARFAAGNKATKLWIGSYAFDEESLILVIKLNKDKNSILIRDIAMSIDLNTAKRTRVLEAITTPDPDEPINGADIDDGSRVQITGFPREYAIPFRLIKNRQEESYFSDYDREANADTSRLVSDTQDRSKNF